MKLLERIKSYMIASPVGYFNTAVWTSLLADDISKFADGQGSTGEVIWDVANLLVWGMGISYKNIYHKR